MIFKKWKVVIQASCLILLAQQSSYAEDKAWEKTLQEARGQTVFFNAWGGRLEINNYLDNIATKIKKLYDVTLVHVKVDDIATSVNQLRTAKKAGQIENGSIDLMWINGANFKAMLDADLLGASFASSLPNITLLDSSLPLEEDFTIKTQGKEVAWGIGQLNFMVDTDKVKIAPQSQAELLIWSKENPGRFTYPKPPEFHGSSFLKQILLELIEQEADLNLLYQEAKSEDFTRITKTLWQWLDDIHPHLWRKGKVFPNNTAEIKQLLDDGELAIALSFNPQEAEASVKNGSLPKSTVAFAMKKGALTNTHFLAIPFNAKAHAGAKVVANYLISAKAQSEKADTDIWGDPSVLKQDVLSAKVKSSIRFKSRPEPHPSWQLLLEQEWKKRYGS